MNNVWTSITCRAPVVVRPVRPPLLYLFNGYAKSLRASQRPQRCKLKWEQQWHSSRTLSTTSCLAVKKKQDKRRAPPPLKAASTHIPKSDSKLEPALTIASHTEGLPKEEELLTWRDYDPVGGMPLPNGELTQPEINAVFDGEEVDADTGNYILSVMHWRRMSGALIDSGLDFPRTSGVDQEMALKGLQYIRTIMPDVDEAATGQTWVDEESQRLQEQIQERAVKLGLYKPEVIEEEPPEEQLQGTEVGRERTGESVLQQTRQANEAAWEQEQAQKAIVEQKAANAEAHKFRGPLELGSGVQPMIQRVDGTKTITTTMPSGVSIRPPAPKAWLKPVERKEWVKYYEEQATIVKENAVPQLSTIRRLGPPLLIALLVLAGCYYLSINYTPPPTSARIWPDTPPAVATLTALTSVLLASFLLGRLPQFWKFYNKYMILAPAYPYALSIIGTMFRHDTIYHLASNLVSLWLFGLLLHEDVGRGTFLAIYLGTGVVGAYSMLLYNVLRKQWLVYTLGSSGSVLGVAAAAVTLRPNGQVKVFGYEVPIAAWVFLAMFTGAEIFAAVRGIGTGIDHITHLGGIAAGVGSGFWMKAHSAGAKKTELRAPGGNVTRSA